MDWPSGISKPWLAFAEDAYNPVIQKEFEAGYSQTRPRYTRAKKRFTLRWDYMPTTEVDLLRDFYEDDAVGGAAFTWQHPISGAYHAVRFTEDELICTRLSAAWWAVEVRLEEV